MQVTIDIPDELARKLEPNRDQLAEIIERGLGLPSTTAVAEEAAEFLARGPQPQEIVAFRPSEASVRRASELLEKNREGTLTADEKAELEEISVWNQVFSLIKACARMRLQSGT